MSEFASEQMAAAPSLDLASEANLTSLPWPKEFLSDPV
jgi:hypothetical protein